MSYSEAITKNDLQNILNTFGYADNDWTTPNITYDVSDKTEKTSTAQDTHGTTLVTINHTTQTGRFLVLSSAVIKTSRYTSYTTIAVNGEGVGAEWGVTNLTTPTTVHNVIEIKNKEIGSSHIIELKLGSQDSGTTATRPAYNPSILCAIDILDTKAKGSRILECYPVGSYYETSDADFNPNTAWGGTWSKLTKHNIITKNATNVTLKTHASTAVTSVTLPANSKWLLFGLTVSGQATTGVTSNCQFTRASGTGDFYPFSINSVSASSGAYLNAQAYVDATTQSVINLTRYNYTSADITNAFGNIVAIPLDNYNDGKITWHRTA